MLLPLFVALCLTTLLRPVCSVMSPGDRALVEKFYKSRTGDNLQWNRAKAASQDDNWNDLFLHPHEKTGSNGIGKEKKCSEVVPKFETGMAECKKNNHTTGDCFLFNGKYTCECNTDWQCPIPGNPSSSCNVTTFPCANVTTYCDEQNYAECMASTDPCQLPVCSCKSGWTTDWNAVKSGSLQCQADIDECKEASPCEHGGICTNTVGSYTCQCPEKWAGQNCEFIKRCTDSDVETFCGANAYCIEGVMGDNAFGTCKCKAGFDGDPYTGCGLSNKACSLATQDPYISTFDGGRFSYMGTRPVTLARPSWYHDDRPYVPYFKVVYVSYQCYAPYTACIGSVYVDIRNSTNQFRIHFAFSNEGYFDVDGERQKPNYAPPEVKNLFTVTATRTNVFQLSTEFGVTVDYDTTYALQGTEMAGARVTVCVPKGSVYDGHMYGLAGNMDGNPNNDETNGDLFVPENENGSYSGAGGKLQSDMPPRKQSDADWAKSNSKCRYLVEEGSPFDMCRTFLNETVMRQAFENCAIDKGARRNTTSFDDNTCEEYLLPIAQQCRNAVFKLLGVDTWKWRNQTGCPPPTCGENAFFNEKSPMCLNTCDSPNAQLYCHQSELQETCMCKESDSVKYVLAISGPKRCLDWRHECTRPHKGISMALTEESVDLKCNQNCLFVSQESNIVCKPMECKANSRCTVKDGLRDCLCNDGYIGDGRVECRVPQRDCADLQKYFGVSLSGVPEIGIWGPIGERQVLCDMTTNGGGYTVIQRRVGNTTGFDRLWQDYVNGFGSSLSNDFWYGLEALHIMTNYATSGVNLRVELTDCADKAVYQEYENVKVGPVEDNYRLYYGRSSGTAGDALQSLDPDSNSANGMQFSTSDRDNDAMPGLSCAQFYSGGWWFRQCSTSNLNGVLYPNCGGQDQLNTLQWLIDPQQPPHSYKLVEMKIRPTIYPPTD